MDAAAHGVLAALRQAALAVDGRFSGSWCLFHQPSMADAAPTLSERLERALSTRLARPVSTVALAGRCSKRLFRASSCAVVDLRPPLRAEPGRDAHRVGHALEVAEPRVEADRVAAEAGRVAAEAGRVEAGRVEAEAGRV